MTHQLAVFMKEDRVSYANMALLGIAPSLWLYPSSSRYRPPSYAAKDTRIRG
jgi:hypothetical protein